MVEEVFGAELFRGAGNDFIEHFVLALTNGAIIKSYHETKKLVISVTINGQSVPVSKFLSNIETQLDRLINERAYELYKEKLEPSVSNIIDTARKLERNTKRKVRELLKIEKCDEDY